MFATPADREAAISAGVGLVWALGCTGKFIWPPPQLERLDATYAAVASFLR
jgi:hypothetical protein